MPVPQYSYDELKPQLVDLYRRLAEFAEPGNVRIGIETGWPRPEQLVDLVEAVDHPRVGITVDVGHLIYTLTPTQRDDPRAPLIYNELLIAHVRTAAPWLIHVHVHDVCYHDWRDHVALGDGIIDWPCLISVLEDAHYKGLLSLELEEACSKQALGRGFDFLVALVTKSSH
jgi:sugar phosphate isomerase/epimerase